jgi:F420-dependent methylenetetrahydromethanopterin dehydrogenase
MVCQLPLRRQQLPGPTTARRATPQSASPAVIATDAQAPPTAARPAACVDTR